MRIRTEQDALKHGIPELDQEKIETVTGGKGEGMYGPDRGPDPKMGHGPHHMGPGFVHFPKC